MVIKAGSVTYVNLVRNTVERIWIEIVVPMPCVVEAEVVRKLAIQAGIYRFGAREELMNLLYALDVSNSGRRRERVEIVAGGPERGIGVAVDKIDRKALAEVRCDFRRERLV